MKILAVLLILWFLPNLAIWVAQWLLVGISWLLEKLGKTAEMNTPVRWLALAPLAVLTTPFMLVWIVVKYLVFQIFRLFLRIIIKGRRLIY